MRDDLEKRIYAAGPNLFDSESKPSVCCGDGWFGIILELTEDLECMGARDGLSAEVKASQIKEKFGGLRYYLDGPVSDEMYERISAAEDRSFKTCEACGSTDGVVTSGKGWLTSLCEKCRTK